MTSDEQKRDDWKQRMQDYLFRAGREAALADDLDFLDRCAIAAMQGDLAEGDFKFRTLDESVAYAYRIAEAMLAERNRRRANRAN